MLLPSQLALAPNAIAQEKETDAQPPEEKNVIKQVVHTTTKVIDKTINVVANMVDVPLQVTKNVLDTQKTIDFTSVVFYYAP